ncbi:MAG: stage III sporulation protein AD [Clostridia bacterium]|nr:stage III sporulation protein AD [Clostridia bacterium]
MEIFKIACVGIITAVCVVNLREIRGDIALIVGLVGGIIILLCVLDSFTEVFAFFNEMISATGLDGSVVKSLLKIIGIGYVAEFSASVCEESGAKGVGEKIILGGKVIILLLSIPIIKLLLEIVTSLLV